MLSTLPTQEQVDQIARELAPDVVRIRFHEDYNRYDVPVIRFQVILEDRAFTDDHLIEITRKVRDRVVDSLGLDHSDRRPHFRYRSVSDQEKVREASWE